MAGWTIARDVINVVISLRRDESRRATCIIRHQVSQGAGFPSVVQLGRPAFRLAGGHKTRAKRRRRTPSRQAVLRWLCRCVTIKL